MNTLLIEFYKEKRTGVIPVLLAAGVLGMLYAFVNFIVRKETLLNMPIPPMDILLTQVYGMIMILNMFAIVVATCIGYNMEFSGNAVKKMYMLPISIAKIYFSKFLVLEIALVIAIILQNLVLGQIGMTQLPEGSFEGKTLINFAIYALITALPVLTFMLLVASRFENMWMPLGIGVAGFLTGMALATSRQPLFMIHPFVVMLKPAVAMSAYPETTVLLVAILETTIFLCVGLFMANNVRYE